MILVDPKQTSPNKTIQTVYRMYPLDHLNQPFTTCSTFEQSHYHVSRPAYLDIFTLLSR